MWDPWLQASMGEVARDRQDTEKRRDGCVVDTAYICCSCRCQNDLLLEVVSLAVLRDVCNRQVLAIANAVRENQGLVELTL
jgi:hypothetical protein